MPSDKETSIYGVDQGGKVWVLSGQGNGKSTWTALPNPGRLDFKRLAAVQGSLWGISSDHQIYVYVHKSDIPVRVREEVFENQRWNPMGGFCNNLLPTDRYPFSNEEGTENRAKDLVKLPSEGWIWKGDWQIDNTFEGSLVDEGWTYAVDFPATYNAQKDWKSCVRRRKWYRIREYIAMNRWSLVPSADEDFTKDPFSDVSASTFGELNPDLSCVWAITVNGQVYHRKGVSRSNPEGTHWMAIPVTKGVQDAAQVAVAANGTPFVVAWTGGILYRVGITPQRLEGTDWIAANGPPGGIFQLSAGKNAMWAISRDRECWALKGELLKILSNKSLEPLEWIKIPGTGRIKAVTVSKTDLVVMALGSGDNPIFYRYGITEEQLHGREWREAFEVPCWETSSTSSELSESAVMDQIDSYNSSSDDISIRIDVPQGVPIAESSEHLRGAMNLCWIDGGCASMLKLGPDPDMEVGPWREEILSGLQFRKCERKRFSFPNAVESDSSSWTKSIKCRMLRYGRGISWMKGELEISNGDALVFYKDLHHSWMCGIADILSVLLSREMVAAFTIRVRSGIEPGVAEFVTFKFENENSMEELRMLLVDLSSKPKDEWMLSNAWVTTTAGEIHDAGLVKMADTPVGAEVMTESPNSEIKIHHPLLKGFLPGSELIVDLVIPASAVRFALNLNGKDSSIFHFNPRMTDQFVVRNSRDSKGDWGEEERDGVFPFQQSVPYTIHIACTDSQYITTVVAKHKFIFHYKHRFPPKYVTHFTAVGDVNIVGVRYEAARSEDVKHIEFITAPVPGHFWKVESAGNKLTWALGVDLNVWVYTKGVGNWKTGMDSRMMLSADVSKNLSKSDNIVTDEQVYYIYENQRWNPLTGFGSHGLPTDRAPWSDETGTIPLEKDCIKLPSNKWSWVADWETDYTVKGGVDKMGWQYALDFPASYHSSKRFNDFVRRRRWKRVGRHATAGPWVQIPNIKLIDVCLRMNDDCDYEALGVCHNGDAVARCGMCPENPIGTHWEPLTSQKPFISISGWYKQHVWAIGKDGFAYIRYQNHWQLLDRPSAAPLRQIRVGPNGVWAVGTNNALYRRSDIQPVFPEGKEWVKACDGVIQVSIGGDETLWGLIKNGDQFKCSIAKRKGISPNFPCGVGWELIAEGPWRHFSATGAYGRNL